jgi:hypothetical protein
VNPFQAKRHSDSPISPRDRSGGVFVSQSRNWLTERFAYPPQVRLVFGEELPQFAGAIGKFEEQ